MPPPFAGVVASLGYLFFLGVKTDTIGEPDAKLGANVSNLRFAMPVLVLVGVVLFCVLWDGRRRGGDADAAEEASEGSG